MALKGDRLIVETDTTNICNDVIVQKGAIVCYDTPGSGSAMNDINAGYVKLAPGSASGKVPAGLSLATFVNIDQTRQHRNYHKDEQVVGEKAPLAVKGWFTTDQSTGTPTVGAPAYLGASGQLTPTLSTTGGLAATPRVGLYKSIVDESGFVKVEINLPY